jgi:hypothetical protein
MICHVTATTTVPFVDYSGFFTIASHYIQHSPVLWTPCCLFLHIACKPKSALFVACPCGHCFVANLWQYLSPEGAGIVGFRYVCRGVGMGWAVGSGMGSRTSPFHYDVWSILLCSNTLLSSPLCYATGIWVSTDKWGAAFCILPMANGLHTMADKLQFNYNQCNHWKNYIGYDILWSCNTIMIRL